MLTMWTIILPFLHENIQNTGCHTPWLVPQHLRPIHRIPKARSSFASRLSKLIDKAISSNSLLDWQRMPCFPLSVLSSSPESEEISLTVSIKSRISAYLWSDCLPKSEASPRHNQPTPQRPSQKHEDTGKPKTMWLQYQGHHTNFIWELLFR